MNQVLLNELKDYDLIEQSIGIVDGKASTWIHLKLKPKSSKPFDMFQQEKYYFEVNSYITWLAPEIAKWVKLKALPPDKTNFGVGRVTIK